MKQEAVKAPKYVRTIDIVLGAISLIFAGLVLASPAFAATLLIIFLSIALLFAGCEGIVVGATGRGLAGGQRALRLIVGVIAVGLSMAVLVFPGGALLSSVVLLSIAFLFLGAAAIGKGITEKFMAGWARAMYVIVGGIAIALSIPVIAFPGFGLLTLYTMMATILIVNGAGYVIAGITGAVYVPIGVSIARRGRTWESDAA
jgi:uncharacterized membrane protein HdeD (DUF308 family)